MTFFDNRIPEYITNRKNTIRQLIFTALFALVFINLYSPFRVDTWYEISEAERFFYSSLVIIAGLLIIAISRMIMLSRTKKRPLTNGNYILWIVVEIVSLAAFYVILEKVILKPEEDMFIAYKNTLKITALVLLLPYTITYLYFSWLEKNRRLEELQNSGAKPKNDPYKMIPFHDDRGDLRFSVKEEDLLYLEAADNYVLIHYLDDDKRAKYMIRNTLKSLEEKLENESIIRCHRSYIVNFNKVAIVRKERDGLVLELDLPGKNALPISRTYVNAVMKVFSAYPGD